MLPVPLIVVVAATQAAAAAPVAIEGTVYVDENRNGVFDSDEPTVPGVAVWVETALVAHSGADGHFGFNLAENGILWARIPDGFEPTPVWTSLAVADGPRSVDLGLVRQAATGNVSFIHASDSHVGNGIGVVDVRRAFDLAVQVEPRPHFLVVTGDITNDSSEDSFQTVLDIMAGLDVPFVPVVGNHDNYDGEVAYKKLLGPSQYCFDQGGVRFVVLDFSLLDDVDGMLGFVDRCLADSGGMPVAAFIHAPMVDETSLRFADHGIDYLFTGHWHSNRLIEHGSMEEVNTQTFVNGGIDDTPAGYRIASFDGERLRYRQRTIVEHTVLAVMWPPAAGCVAPGAVDVIVAAEAGTTLGEVTVALDGGAAVATSEHGGWDRVATLCGLTVGQHSIAVGAPGGLGATRPFCVSDTPRVAAQLADWTQLQGAAAHAGFVPQRIEPPLEHLWARSVGGYLRGGSVVVAGERVFAPVVDLGDGSAGGVVALDARTGAVLWERRVGYAVHNAPAVVGDLVVFGAASGMVRAVSAATGADVWSYDLGQGFSQNYSWLYSPPTVADGVVYIGVERRFSALDAATGRELWSVNPSPSSYWLGSYSAAGVGGGVVITAVSRGADGIVGLDALDGHELWRVPAPLATAVNSGIVVDGSRAYLTNTYATVFALDLVAPPAPDYAAWQTDLHSGMDPFSYGVFGTPALAGTRIIVPTMHGALVALDEGSGSELWRVEGDSPVIRPIHSVGPGHAAFAGSPVVTGDLVWVGGADGKLSALSLDSGQQAFALDLGAPILSGPVPAGDVLYVGTFDGTIHALWHPVGLACPDAPGCVVPANDDGCGVAGGGGRGALGWLGALAVLAMVGLMRKALRSR